MVRDLNEVVASQRDMLAGQGKHGAKVPDDILKHTYITQLKQTRKFLVLRQIAALYVQYRDCIENPHAEAARINRFFGGVLDEDEMATAVDGELYRHKDGRGLHGHGFAAEQSARREII